MGKKIGLLSGLIGVLMISPLAAAEDIPQAQWVGDLPIMPSLEIEKGLGFAFDNPEGRIVTIYLSGGAEPQDVFAYYDIALAPLGWEKTDRRQWRRQGESLSIHKTPTAATDLWKIMLRPE